MLVDQTYDPLDLPHDSCEMTYLIHFMYVINSSGSNLCAKSKCIHVSGNQSGMGSIRNGFEKYYLRFKLESMIYKT